MSPDHKRANEQALFNPNDPQLQPYRKQVSSIQGESAKLRGIPEALEEQEHIIVDTFTVARDGLAQVLLSPEKRRLALEYCAIGAQMHESAALLGRRFDESMAIANKKHRNGNYPKAVGNYLNSIVSYVAALDMADPIASLDPKLPELAETPFPVGGLLLANAQSQKVAEAYARIGTNFSQGEGFEQTAVVAFLAELGINKYLIQEGKQRTELRKINVHSETQNDLNSAGIVMNQYFISYARYLFARIYGEPVSEHQQIAYPDYNASSFLPYALGAYLAETRDGLNDYRYMLPTNFKALLEHGLIPHLPAEAVDAIAARQAERFYQRNGDVRNLKKDAAGRRPYALAELSYTAGTASSYFDQLGVEYAEQKTPPSKFPVFENIQRMTQFLRHKIVTSEGDRQIAAIDISATMSYLDIIIIGHNTDANGNPETVTMQIDDLGRVYGLPTAYGYAAEPLLDYIIDKSIKALEANGFRLLSMEDALEELDLELTVEEQMLRLDSQLRKRVKNQEDYVALYTRTEEELLARERQQRAIERSALPLPVEETQEPPVRELHTQLHLPVEQAHDVHVQLRRFTIEVPQEILAELAPDIQKGLKAAVERVEFSPFGSHIMRKLESIGEDYYRIAFSGHRAILRKDDQGRFRVTQVLKRDSQTYNVVRRSVGK